jgi:hypothetical protein
MNLSQRHLDEGTLPVIQDAKRKIDQIICVCCARDAIVWKIASMYITKNIDSVHYKVIVPDNEVELFKKISSKPFEILGESVYTKRFASEIKKRLSNKISGQFGWYLQQFIKLSAVAGCKAHEIVLIWDADTVPLKKLVFIDEQGRLNYYRGTEHHQPYFETIERLLHLSKKVNFSFIAQCFAIKAEWIQELFDDIEKKHDQSWELSLLDAINFEEGNSFSEYETLGTFVSEHHASEINYIQSEWLRLGNSTIGHPAFLSPHIISKKLNQYDFVSFEKWDKAKPYFWKVSLPFFLKVYLPAFFKPNTNT